MTSAPRSPSNMAQNGPAAIWQISMTRTPESESSTPWEEKRGYRAIGIWGFIDSLTKIINPGTAEKTVPGYSVNRL